MVKDQECILILLYLSAIFDSWPWVLLTHLWTLAGNQYLERTLPSFLRAPRGQYWVGMLFGISHTRSYQVFVHHFSFSKDTWSKGEAEIVLAMMPLMCHLHIMLCLHFIDSMEMWQFSPVEDLPHRSQDQKGPLRWSSPVILKRGHGGCLRLPRTSCVITTTSGAREPLLSAPSHSHRVYFLQKQVKPRCAQWHFTAV